MEEARKFLLLLIYLCVVNERVSQATETQG